MVSAFQSANPLCDFLGLLVLILLLAWMCILCNRCFFISTDFNNPSAFIEYFPRIQNYAICYIGTLYGTHSKRRKEKWKATMIKLTNIFVLLSHSALCSFTYLPVATPHSSLFQMAVGARQQELLDSERLSQCMDEWMGDHVFTLLFLVFCFWG